MDIKEVADAMQHIEEILFRLKCKDGVNEFDLVSAHKKAQKVMEQYLLPLGAFKE